MPSKKPEITLEMLLAKEIPSARDLTLMDILVQEIRRLRERFEWREEQDEYIVEHIMEELKQHSEKSWRLCETHAEMLGIKAPNFMLGVTHRLIHRILDLEKRLKELKSDEVAP